MADDLHAEVEAGQMVVGRVLVVRVLNEDGTMHDDVLCDDGNGEDIDMPTAVGMLAIAQHLIVCERD